MPQFPSSGSYKSVIPSLSSSQSMSLESPSPSISESTSLGPSSLYLLPLIWCNRASLSKSQSQSMSIISIIPSPSSSTSSQFETPSPSQSLNWANDALWVIHLGSGFTGLGLDWDVHVAIHGSEFLSRGNESFSFSIWSLSISYAKSVAENWVCTASSGVVVPPMSGSSQSQIAL